LNIPEGEILEPIVEYCRISTGHASHSMNPGGFQNLVTQRAPHIFREYVNPETEFSGGDKMWGIHV
jgi:hypothetical protein